MAKNILVIGVDLRETRVALIEDGVIAEMHIERQGAKQSTVGNVYLGKVTRVLPGLQAAFIDIGQERAAFLHVEDLIRPDDFEAYLAGGLKTMRADEDKLIDASDDDDEVLVPTAVDAPAAEQPAAATEQHEPHQAAEPHLVTEHPLLVEHVEMPKSAQVPASESSDASAVQLVAGVEEPPFEEAHAFDLRADVADVHAAPANDTLIKLDLPLQVPEETDSDEDVAAADAQGNEEDEEDSEDDELDAADALAGAELDPLDAALEEGAKTAPPSKRRAAAKTAPKPSLDDDDLFDLPGFTVSDPGEAVPRAGAPRGGDNGRRRGRGGRRGGAGGGRREEEGQQARTSRQAPPPPNPNRITKSTPIAEVVKEGQDVIVQVTKDTIGTKGARCSSHISLPGRYVVYLPTVEHVGVSKRIGNDKERSRLRDVIDSVKPPTGGLVVRTVAEGLTKKQLKQDVGYLVRLWGEVAKMREGAKSPALLAGELDLTLKVARDLFTDEVDAIIIDNRAQYERLYRFLEAFAPDRLKDIQLYTGEEPIFDAYGIETEIKRALDRKVMLPSGGYLVIDQAEALTAIDVNTGRFVGKGSKDMEETILKTNIEAVHEIAYQLRFRNIGGLIILDLIDMEKMSNREKVRRTLEELLQKDKAKTTLNRISELGLIEMTRKRTRESLGRFLHEPCFYCDGTGQLQSKETVAYEILREMRRKHSGLAGYTIQVNAHPAVVDLLNGTERDAVQEAENKFMRKIIVVPRKDYHLEQFEISGK